ncbi:MAG TPA: hypothetical protein VEC13_00615, partial [Candidatus Paceibacterota bacterium]|nr:hypothetical protein [Candidatus Paceibacterota bacterium]
MDQTFRPQEKGSVLTAEEVALLESLFQHNLKESPIDLAAYEKLAETDEDLRFVLNEMLTNCLNYTEDVARMERYAREHKGEY